MGHVYRRALVALLTAAAFSGGTAASAGVLDDALARFQAMGIMARSNVALLNVSDRVTREVVADLPSLRPLGHRVIAQDQAVIARNAAIIAESTRIQAEVARVQAEQQKLKTASPEQASQIADKIDAIEGVYRYEAAKNRADAKKLQTEAKRMEALMQQLDDFIDKALSRLQSGRARFLEQLDNIVVGNTDRMQQISRAKTQF